MEVKILLCLRFATFMTNGLTFIDIVFRKGNKHLTCCTIDDNHVLNLEQLQAYVVSVRHLRFHCIIKPQNVD
jgi:hypothetical protein